MFSLFQLVNQAFEYTKNHKQLWFFGFFLTSWGGISFIRRLDFSAEKFHRHLRHAEHFVTQPNRLLLAVIIFLCAIFIAFFLGAVARSVLIHAAATLESKKPFVFAETLKQTKKSYTRIFLLGLVANIIMVFILVAMFAPLYIAFSRGLTNQSVILSIAALAIYLPVVIIISLVNIFASCYIVLYDLKVLKAVQAAFDLIGNCFDKVLALLTLLIAIYAISFIFSFLLFGTVSGLIYFLGFNLKTLAISSFFVIIVAALVALAVLLLLINAILNVFTNIAWTLFFIKIVKAEHLPKTQPALVHMGG